jgi:hypothetical protein
MIEKFFSRILIHCYLVLLKIRISRPISTRSIIRLVILLIFVNPAGLGGRNSTHINQSAEENILPDSVNGQMT